MRLNRTPDFYRRIRRRAAYTLVEVLCSIFIAAIAAAALFVGFDNGFAILRTTREELRATQILMQRTEAFRLFAWEQLSNVPTTFQESYYPAGVSTNTGTLYWGTVSTTDPATNVPDSVTYKNNLHLITITVVWTNYIGSTERVYVKQMQTLSAKNGLQNYIYGATNSN
jgi:prepilin-type N-terminal cleavage/methylation domain-containing protein